MAAVSPELVDLLKALFADKHGELAQALQREAWAADWALKLDPHERTSPDVWLHQLALRARLEGCEAELLALLRKLRAKRVAEIDAVAGVLRPAEPPAVPAPPTGGATPHPGVKAEPRAALAQSAPPEGATALPSGPTLILHLTRAARGDRRAVALPSAPLDYHRHLPDGRVRVFTLDWPALIPHVTGLSTARSADAVLGLGRALREALLPSGWDELEDALAETLRHGPALLLIQVNADELHALPWEAMPLGGDGPPLAEARGLTILHHQPGVRPPPSPRGAPKAILLAWAGARGRVPAAAVEAALGEGVTSLASPRVDQLVAALSRGHHDALVLLAHGARQGDIIGLAWGDELLTPARLVAALRGLPKPPPRVILLACRSGDAPIGELGYGGLGLELHRLGVPWVLASRWSLSVEGAVTLAEGLARGDPRGALPTGSVDRLGVVVYGAAAPPRRLGSPAVGLGLLSLGLLSLGLITKLLISPTTDPVEPPPPAPAAPSGDLRLTLLYLEQETPGASRSDAWADALGAALAQRPRAVLLYAERRPPAFDPAPLAALLRANPEVPVFGLSTDPGGAGVPYDLSPLLGACPEGPAGGCVILNLPLPPLEPDGPASDRVRPCHHTTPTAALALARLAQTPIGLTEPLFEACREGEVLGLLPAPAEPCAGPYRWLWASELTTGPQTPPRDPLRERGAQVCDDWAGVKDRVVVLADPWADGEERSLRDDAGALAPRPRAEALAVAAWTTLGALEGR